MKAFRATYDQYVIELVCESWASRGLAPCLTEQACTGFARCRGITTCYSDDGRMAQLNMMSLSMACPGDCGIFALQHLFWIGVAARQSVSQSRGSSSSTRADRALLLLAGG